MSSPVSQCHLAGRIIAIGNIKGGVGKSTVTVNLAGWLTSHGMPVTVIDTDPQATAYEWLCQSADIAVQHQPLKHLDQAGQWIETAQQARQDQCVIIDLPAVATAALVAAMMIANAIIIPITPSAADIKASEQTLKFARQCAAKRPANSLQTMLVPNRISRRMALSQALLNWLDYTGAQALPGLGMRTLQAEAIAHGTWVGALAPASKAALEVDAMARALVRTLTKMPIANDRIQATQCEAQQPSQAQPIQADNPTGINVTPPANAEQQIAKRGPAMNS